MTLTLVIDGAYYKRNLARCMTQQHDRIKSGGMSCMLMQWKDAFGSSIYFQFCRADPRDLLDFNQRRKRFHFRGRSLKRLNVLAMYIVNSL